MIIYLAGEVFGEEIFQKVNFKFNRLDSFMYANKLSWQKKFIPFYKNYILDSGAFTFIMQAKKQKKVSVDIDSFTDQYIDFIVENKVQNFFEMDVDVVYGYDKVKQLRSRIEQKTGRKTIPVYHMSRGIEDFKAMTKEYDYIALGLGGKDFSFTDWKTFKAFNDYAKANKSRVHMLGVTGMTVLDKVDFYSVDSSSWTAGNRYGGFINQFKNGRMEQIQKPKGFKIKDHKVLALHNLKEWIRFADYKEGGF